MESITGFVDIIKFVISGDIYHLTLLEKYDQIKRVIDLPGGHSGGYYNVKK